MSRAGAGGFIVETVHSPSDHDWTAAVLSVIERSGAAPIAIASISSVLWTDGCTLDINRIAPALRSRGAALLIDATHGAGILELDVHKLEPDFVVFPTYKWLLGPYGRAFLYVARRHQDAVPLEQTSAGRRRVNAERMSISAISIMPTARGASTWASAIILFRWKWRRSASSG